MAAYYPQAPRAPLFDRPVLHTETICYRCDIHLRDRPSTLFENPLNRNYQVSKMHRSHSITSIILAAILLGLAGCDGSSSGSGGTPAEQPPPAMVATAQALHASPDAPPVIISFNGIPRPESTDYGEGTPVINLTAGDVDILVEGVLPGGNAPVIGPLTTALAADTFYRIVAVNDVANIEPIILEEPESDVVTGTSRLRVLHAAPLAPEVDVYLTSPGADLAASAAVGTFAFRGDLGPVEVAAGDYQIRITAAGDPQAVVFDSGTVTLASGSNLLVAAVENTTTGPSPVNLVVQPAAAGETVTLHDVATPANVRVIHASPDAPAVDIVVNDDFAMPLVSNLEFPDFTPFVSVPPDEYNVKVVPGGTRNAVIDANLDLAAGVSYSILAINTLGAGIEALVADDDPRRVSTEAKVRIIHAAPAAGDVDIYVTPVGADIGNETPTLSGVAFGANTGFLSLSGGEYDVTVTSAGSKSAAIGPATVALTDGGIYTAVARDATGGGAPLGLILLDDFNP